MATNCTGCTLLMQNLGISTLKKEDFGVPVKMFIFPTYQADGVTLNTFDLTANIDDTALQAVLWNPEPLERFALINKLKNVVITPAQPTFEELNGDKRKTGETPATVSFSIWDNLSFVVLGKYNSMNCTDLSVIWVDECGRLLGRQTDAYAKLAGIPINEETIVAMYNYAVQNTSGASHSITFDYDRNISYGDYFVVPCEMVTANLNTNSMMDLNLTFVSASTTEVKIKALTAFGNASGFQPYADSASLLKIYDASGDLVVTTNTIDTTTGIITATGTFATEAHTAGGDFSSVGFDLLGTAGFTVS